MKIKLNLARLKEVRSFSHAGRVVDSTKICERMKGVYVDVKRGWFVATNDEAVAVRKNILRCEGDDVMHSQVDGFVLTKDVMAQLAKQKLMKKDVEVEIERAANGCVKLVFNGMFETVVPGKYGYVNWEAVVESAKKGAFDVDLAGIIKAGDEGARNYRTLKEKGLRDKTDWDAWKERKALIQDNPFPIMFAKNKVLLKEPHHGETIQEWTLEKDTDMKNVGLSVEYANKAYSFAGSDAAISFNVLECFVFKSLDNNKVVVLAPMK